MSPSVVEVGTGVDAKEGHTIGPSVRVHQAVLLKRTLRIPSNQCAASAINLKDGQQFLGIYRNLGLDLELADKAVEAGIQLFRIGFSSPNVGGRDVFGRAQELRVSSYSCTNAVYSSHGTWTVDGRRSGSPD